MTTPAPNEPYDAETVTFALVCLARHSGNVARALTDLRERSALTRIPDNDTLRRWRDQTHAEQYRRIELEYGVELERQVVALARELAYAEAEVERKLIAQIEEDVAEKRLRGRDAAQAAANVAKAKASNIDKVLTMTGRPTAITESRDMMATIKALVDEGVLRVRGADAEGSAELVEG